MKPAAPVTRTVMKCPQTRSDGKDIAEAGRKIIQRYRTVENREPAPSIHCRRTSARLASRSIDKQNLRSTPSGSDGVDNGLRERYGSACNYHCRHHREPAD